MKTDVSTTFYMHNKAALYRTAFIRSIRIAVANRVYRGGVLHTAHVNLVEVTAEIACTESIYTVVIRELGIAVTVRTAEFISLYFCPSAAAAPALQYKFYLITVAVGVFNIEVTFFLDVRCIKAAAVLRGHDRYRLTPCTCRTLSPEQRNIRVAAA